LPRLWLLVFLPAFITTLAYTVLVLLQQALPALLVFYLCATVLLFPLGIDIILCASKKEYGKVSLRSALAVVEKSCSLDCCSSALQALCPSPLLLGRQSCLFQCNSVSLNDDDHHLCTTSCPTALLPHRRRAVFQWVPHQPCSQVRQGCPVGHHNPLLALPSLGTLCQHLLSHYLHRWSCNLSFCSRVCSTMGTRLGQSSCSFASCQANSCSSFKERSLTSFVP